MNFVPQYLICRYLEKTFSRALDHSDPHVVVFLGDLMDEGHIASAESFKSYKRRLDSIFQMPDHIMVLLYIINRINNIVHDKFKYTFVSTENLYTRR